MQYGLGIDTGGTYTDAVIFDFENNKVISTAKSITVKEDLTIGINGALSQIPQEMITAIMLVSLSTIKAQNNTLRMGLFVVSLLLYINIIGSWSLHQGNRYRTSYCCYFYPRFHVNIIFNHITININIFMINH